MKRKCEIPAMTLPPCDLEWGHDGDMHANGGDGFYAKQHLDEHRRRQAERTHLEPEAKKEAEAATADDLSLEQLTDLVGEASGWNDRANITFRREIDRSRVPHRSYVAVSVEICGGKATVSAGGADHRRALVALLQNIEMHHREILRWHKQRCVRAREILDTYGIYHVKEDL